jgi:hypothetical protein
LIERREFTLLAGLVPGPKEPSDRAFKSILRRILRIFVDHGPTADGLGADCREAPRLPPRGKDVEVLIMLTGVARPRGAHQNHARHAPQQLPRLPVLRP